MQTRLLREADASWAAKVVRERWNGPFVVSKGKVHDTRQLPGIVADDEDRMVGLLLYSHEGGNIEIITLDALEPRRGIGRLLLDAILARAVEVGVKRIWLVTSNDNVGAVAFYSRCGFRLVHVWLEAITSARSLKPLIPLMDKNGVPIRDELEFEKRMPNQLPDPTSPSVTPPAGAGGAPSVVADH